MKNQFELSYKDLKSTCNPNIFKFETTESLEPIASGIGQDRGIKALEFGLNVDINGYNLYIEGPSGVGKTMYTKHYLESISKKKKLPQDWCYVYNFDNPNEPIAIPLAAGQGKEFRDAMDRFIKDIKHDIKDTFNNEDFEKEKALIKQEYEAKRSALMDKLNATSSQYGFQVKSANNGIYMMPVINGKTIEEEEFEKLDSETKKDFEDQGNTRVYWLGGGGAMINDHGTVIMIDPLLEGFDMPLLIDMPIDVKDVPHVDAILVSHVDNDHYSRPTCRDLKDVCKEYHTSYYVASLMKEECGLDGIGHDIGDHIQINDIDVELTPADHAWQNQIAKYNYRVWEDREYCGFYVKTPTKKIWYVGDSKLMDCQLHMDPPDVMFFDFADNPVHIGLENAYKLANTYPNTKLVLIHWGSVDAPEASAFNGNPQDILDNVVNPERVVILAPGEEYVVD